MSNGWALWFMLALGADVGAVLPSVNVCDDAFQAAQKLAGDLQLMHARAGGYALEYRIREAKTLMRFWSLAAQFRTDALDVHERLYFARELRRMMGWTP